MHVDEGVTYYVDKCSEKPRLNHLSKAGVLWTADVLIQFEFVEVVHIGSGGWIFAAASYQ